MIHLDMRDGDVVIVKDDEGDKWPKALLWNGKELVDLHDAAHELGKQAGIAAGTWVFNRTEPTQRDYQRIMQGIDDGDPEVLDQLPQPDLSGQWADGPTPRTIMEELGVAEDDEDPLYGELVNTLCEVWSLGYTEGVEFEVTNTIRHHLIEEPRD